MRTTDNAPPPGLAHRIELFAKAMRQKEILGDPNPRNVRARIYRLIAREIREMKEDYTLSTIKGYLTHYRRVLEDLRLNDYTDMIRLSDEDYAELKIDYLQQIHEDQSNLRPLDPNTAIETAVALLGSDRYIAKTAGLMLLTGRRVIEILKTGTFEPTGKDNTVYFDGQAKTREAEGTRQESYEIPVLADPRIIMGAFEAIRAEKDFSEKPNNKVTQGVSKMLTEVVKTNFGYDYKPKDLRSAYAQIAYARFCPRHKTDTVYFSEILGHKLLGEEASDMLTAQSYRDFYIPELTEHFAHGDLAKHPSISDTFFVLDADGESLTLQRATRAGEPDKRTKPFRAPRIEYMKF
jgi:hypothetical protein